MANHYLYFLLWLSSFMSSQIFGSFSLSMINATHPLIDGDTLVSASGNFELGFFTPGNSDKRYVGIWYKKIPVQTVVWVANREAPLEALVSSSSAAMLRLTSESVLELINGTNAVIWATNLTRALKNPVAELLDSGNLIIKAKDNNEEEFDGILWQSFDYPCDIQLPGMKLGKDLIRGLDQYLTSWRNSDDPSLGSYTYRLDYHGYPQPVLMKGVVEQYRNGPWNGIRFSGNPSLKPNPFFTFKFVMNSKATYYVYDLLNSSVISHRLLNPYGTMQRLVWSDHVQGWVMYLTAQSDNCDTYSLCGKFGSCNIANSPECGCLRGFRPKSPNDWNSGDWSDGCVRKAPLSCNRGDRFVKYTNVKLPDTQYSWYNTSMTLNECKSHCLLNCSCVAYASLDVRNGGSGCFIWIDVLIDIKIYPKNGQDLYVKLNASELGKRKRRIWIMLSSIFVAITVLVLTTTLFLWKKMRFWRKGKSRESYIVSDRENAEPELPLFDISLIAQATNNFSDENRIGEGGFGPVYKGILKGGQEIAVKRLSKESRQGLDEFKTEVICIAKLQHRNLVKLLGCCIEGEERMLVYEYMSNKSLDYFIFDDITSKSLEWPKRFEIIKGITRGLLYLHQDSRLRIVHRDLKAGNILLDSELNPKISDFGMARSFEGDECEVKTNKVVGTYGYMSPEYAIDGLFSVKSDVFSFGVLVLETISSKRNRGFNHPDHYHNLLGHVLRCIHIGLLCVQRSPDDRPSMPSVIVMLDNDVELPQPKTPAFFIERELLDKDSLTSATVSESHCSNEMSITVVSGR
ncbi:G-type lectin S-receptor-like serine/threonine-protein kinase At4g27290 isoform X2 [Beta vulgaris subsp. vulgaris]|uniref:G-type lectin S-receptor-like serine/threonine-protein kinase At4g27290 isoform X2 n=1 Tax=Beta vulgaris subsp. vulgaris TaxID=3555 RepID=UPI002036DDB1|nr:G-type lectin S-receptor-like serine/threonine-protein kinase At4g27290 isoform X2 [Beta vulgaris subsp. vulgaris]